MTRSNVIPLFPEPPRRFSGWVNLYRKSDGWIQFGAIYGSKEEAQDSGLTRDAPVATIFIEWEEP